MPNDHYLSPPKAAQYLGISTSKLAKLRVYGGGPLWTRIGRAVRYPLSALDEFMQAGLVRSTSERPHASCDRQKSAGGTK